MLARNNTTVGVADTTAAEAPKFELDFESDEPLPVCPMRPMRQDGSSSDEVCEACQ